MHFHGTVTPTVACVLPQGGDAVLSCRRLGFSTLQACFNSADGGFQKQESLPVKEVLCLKCNESQTQKVLSLHLGEGYGSWIQQKAEGKLTWLNAF